MTEDLTAELHKLAGFYPNTYYGQLMGKAAREIERLQTNPCPYVVTGEEGTSYCRLAENPAAFQGNPAPPQVCKTMAGDCGCHGNCTKKEEG